MEDLESLLQKTGQRGSPQKFNNTSQDNEEYQPDGEDQEELNAVIESISYGKNHTHKRLTFQAFSAAISHQEQVRFVVNYLSNVSNSVHQKFPSAKSKILAYRVNQTDQMRQKDLVAEGFDDDGEAGAGEKLLGLLQKMEIENILIIVCVWSGTAQIGGQQVKGGELFKLVIERARELLSTIHDQIVQNEQQTKRLMDEEQLRLNQGKKQAIGTKVFSLGAAQAQSQERTKIGASPFKTSAIMNATLTSKRNRSPTTVQRTDNQDSLLLLSQSQGGGSQEGTDDEGAGVQSEVIEQQIIKAYGEELTLEDFEEANKEVEESLRQIEKTLQIVCALRGFRNFNWNFARDLLAKPAFKMELMQTKPRTMRPQDVLKAQYSYFFEFLQNVHLHSEGAALLLVWAANIIKLYACTKKFGDGLINPSNQTAAATALKVDEIQKIQARTKIMVKKDQQVKKQQEQEQMNQAIALKQSQDEGTSRQQLGNANSSNGTSGPIKPSGNIGHFLQNKQMVFSLEANQLAPEQQKMEQKGQPPQLVDLSVIKRGGFNQVNSKGRVGQKQDEAATTRQEESTKQADSQNFGTKNQQSTMQSKTTNSKRVNGKSFGEGTGTGIEEGSQQIHEGEGGMYTTDDHNHQLTGDEVPGKLKMHEVRELADDVDVIIGKLRGVDYGVQDLDILIELAKQLKHKRLTLFPDTSNILMSDNFGNYGSLVDEDKK